MKFRARTAPFGRTQRLSREYTLIRQRSYFPYYRDLYRPSDGGAHGYIFSLNSFRRNEDKTLATASHRFSSRLMTLIPPVLFLPHFVISARRSLLVRTRGFSVLDFLNGACQLDIFMAK